MSDFKAKMHQIRFRLTAAGFYGPTSKERGKGRGEGKGKKKEVEGRGRGGEGKKGREGITMGFRLPKANFLVTPLQLYRQRNRSSRCLHKVSK